MNLYEVSKELERIYRLIEANDGEIPEDLETHLAALEGTKADKIKNLFNYIKNLEVLEEKRLEESELWKKKAKQAEKQAEWFKGYLASCLPDEGFHTELGTIKAKRLVPSVIVDSKALPDDYFEEKTVRKRLSDATIREAAQKDDRLAGLVKLVNRYKISLH